MAGLEIDSGTKGTVGWRRLTGTDREGEAVVRIHTETKNVGMTLNANREAELRQWLNERHSENLRPAAQIRNADRA